MEQPNLEQTDLNDMLNAAYAEIDAQSESKIENAVPLHNRTAFENSRPTSSGNNLKQTLKSAMPSVLVNQNGLMPEGGFELSYFQKLMLRREQGLLTKTQIQKSLALAFETEFKHNALKMGLWLSEANQVAVTEFLKRTAQVRKDLGKYSATEIVRISDLYFDGIERAYKARNQWRAKIDGLTAQKIISVTEADEMRNKANREVKAIELQIDEIAKSLHNNLMDMLREAINVNVQDLLVYGGEPLQLPN